MGKMSEALGRYMKYLYRLSLKEKGKSVGSAPEGIKPGDGKRVWRNGNGNETAG